MSRIAAPCALFEQLFAHIFGRADVEAAGGLRGEDDARVAGDLARQHHFLNVAAGEVLGQGVLRGVLTWNFLINPSVWRA
jgi:hypothetical protein